jgi:hypothetical protein
MELACNPQANNEADGDSDAYLKEDESELEPQRPAIDGKHFCKWNYCIFGH